MPWWTVAMRRGAGRLLGVSVGNAVLDENAGIGYKMHPCHNDEEIYAVVINRTLIVFLPFLEPPFRYFERAFCF